MLLISRYYFSYKIPIYNKKFSFKKTMQNTLHNKLNLQNQPICQTIDNSYVQILADFLRLISYQHFIFYQSISTVTLPRSEQNNKLISEVQKFLLFTVQGNIAVPVSDMHWLYLKQTLIQNQIKNTHDVNQTVSGHMNNLLEKENHLCGGNQKYEKSKTVLINKEQKIEGYEHKLCSLGIEQRIISSEIKKIELELMIFEVSVRQQKAKLQQMIQNQQYHSSNYQKYRYFGVGIPINISEEGFNQFISKIIYLDLDSIQQKNANPQIQTHKNWDKIYIPILIQLQNLLYLIGFKKQKEIIFTEQLVTLLNKRISSVEGKINLGSENIGYEGIKYIQMYKWQNLQFLNLWWNMLGELGARAISQGYFPHLNVLDLRKNFIGNKGLDWISMNLPQSGDYMSNFPNLQQLLLTDNNLTSAHQITSIIFPRLNQLQLQNNNLQMNDLHTVQISCINTLKILSLRNNKITGQGLNNLNLPNLQTLYLSNNMLITCQPLSRAYVPKLKKLILSKNKLTQMRSLRKSIFFIQQLIQELDLSDNQLQQIIGFEEVNFGALKDMKFGNNKNKRYDVIEDVDKINYFSWIFRCQLRSLSLQSPISSLKERKLKITMQGKSFKLQKIKIYTYLLKLLSQNINSS